MTRKQLNVRISPETEYVLDWLCAELGESEGEVVSRALDRMYQERLRTYHNPDPVTQELQRKAEESDAETFREQSEYPHFEDRPQ